MSGRGFIAREPAGVCELCGKKAETCPYGPKGEHVCFPCGMKHEAAAVKQFAGFVLGEAVSAREAQRLVASSNGRPPGYRRRRSGV